jgi:hypothetical protein
MGRPISEHRAVPRGIDNSTTPFLFILSSLRIKALKRKIPRYRKVKERTIIIIR